MQIITNKFRELKILSARTEGIINVTGVSDAGSAAVAASLLQGRREDNALVIVRSFERGAAFAKDLECFFSGKIHVLPEESLSSGRFDAKSRWMSEARFAAASDLSSRNDCVVVAPVATAIMKMEPPEKFKEDTIRLRVGEELDLEDFKKRMAAMGYERAAMTEFKGRFSVRGDIVDVFPVNAEAPYRVELFDTTIDGIRKFDSESQRSLGDADEVEIIPTGEAAGPEGLHEKYQGFLWDYLKPGDAIILDEYDRIVNAIELRIREFGDGLDLSSGPDKKKEPVIGWLTPEQVEAKKAIKAGLPASEGEEWDQAGGQASNQASVRGPHQDSEQAAGQASKRASVRGPHQDSEQAAGQASKRASGDLPFGDLIDLTNSFRGRLAVPLLRFKATLKGIDRLDGLIDLAYMGGTAYNGRTDMFINDVRANKTKGTDTVVFCGDGDRTENIKRMLADNGIRTDVSENGQGQIIIAPGQLSSGFRFPDENLAVYTDGEIFNSTKKKTKRRKISKKDEDRRISSFTQLSPGDYVVHDYYGIGKFECIQQMEVLGVTRDYMKIRYAGTDTLYVPVEEIDKVQTYIGGGGAEPKLNKISGGEWRKAKAKAMIAIQELAEKLLQLSAERQLRNGHAFSPDTPEQLVFEDEFPFVETEDQLKSTEEIKQEMEKPFPMDHLLCGDVGYGKTEVAARAIFKCVQDGKQAALLVPTTVLANQHYHTFLKRFENTPFNVDMLCRFRTEKQQKQTVEKVKEGKIDILIGTHRILSKDIDFKDLGLLVVDEEQRFGVNDKEKLKRLKTNVDVLTLSATPIPRTLHMSLTGVRSMSLLEEPPEDRFPVQTFVAEQDEGIIAEVIEREMARNGQVFVVFNRVGGIRSVSDMLKRIVPEARIAVGHGQMSDRGLEDIIQGFIDREYDILVATTIVESGIDIPNANTMIVLDADKMGLTQLYQLRGRVGRADRMAYAYLFYRKGKELSEQARKRLSAIREFTEFGSGFKVAMKDLEIRGAGNLLGNEQSGHIDGIGYEMYCRLVEEAVQELQGKEPEKPDPETLIELDVDAFIPDFYIMDTHQKLEIYKRISMIASPYEMSDVIDECIDRFGNVPDPVINLMEISYCRHLGGKCGIKHIYRDDKTRYIMCMLYMKHRVRRGTLQVMQKVYGQRLKVAGGKGAFVAFKPLGERELLKQLEKFLELIDENSPVE